MAALEQQFERVFQMLVPINRLSPQRQQQLLAQAEILKYGPREFIFREGARDDYAFFLLDGDLELSAQGQLVKNLKGGSADGVHPLAQLQPRQLSARSKNRVSVLRVDRGLMDKLLAIDGASQAKNVSVNEIAEQQADGDWMTRMLQSELFSRVPAANIQRIFTKLESFDVKAGDVIVEQDAAGDYYYVIQQGRCQVSRKTVTGKALIKLAELGPGDTFGEEALVADSRRNASVTMVTDGVLMRLVKEDFVELIKTPLLSAINLSEGKRKVAEEAAVWVDVRFPEEYANDAIEGSINQPLNTLRMHAERLTRDKPYVVYCDSGSRSSVAAFLLSERGFDVHCLAGGLQAYVPGSAADAVGGSDGDGDLTIEPAKTGGAAHNVAALVPASHRTEIEHDEVTYRTEITTEGVLDADVRASALKAELAKANIKLEEARKYQEQAELARKQLVNDASESLKLERAGLAEEAQKAKQQFEEAQALKEELARAKREAQQQAADLERQRAAEIKEANRQVKEARAQKEELARAKRDAERQAAEIAKKRAAEIEDANRQLEEASALKEELARTKREAREQTAELEFLRKTELPAATREADEARTLREQLTREKHEAEERAAERERLRIAEIEAANERAEEARVLQEQLVREKREAEDLAAEREQERAVELAEANQQIAEARQLKKELADAKRSAKEEAKKIKEQEKVELAEANRQLEEARRLKQEAEEAKRAAEAEISERLKAEQERLAEDARRAQAVLEEAERLKQQVAREKELAEAEAARKHEEQQRQFDEMQQQADERLREEEKKLAESYAWQAEEIARLQQLKDDAEQELERERARVRIEASEAKSRLLEAKRIQHEVEQTRVESSKEAEERQQRQIELERKLRDEAQEKLLSERHKIEAEFARNAEELERARREKEAAEAARIAAAEEAERIIQEYKQTHELLREREEEKLLAERQRLGDEATELRGALEQARIEKEQALGLQRAAEEQIADLSADRRAASDAASLASDIAALELEASEAREKAEVAEEAQRKVQAAANANREFMEQNQVQESQSRGRFENEIEGWLEEQEAFQTSDIQQQIMANQKAHLARIKQRAQSARVAAKKHDQSLIDELTDHLLDDE